MINIKKILVSTGAAALMLGAMIVPAFAATTYSVTNQAELVTDLGLASAGDTIVLNNGFDLTSEVVVNVSVTIDGNNQTLTPTFTKSSNSNNSALGIYGSDVVVKDLTVDGAGGTNLHGINVYVATNTLLDNVTLKNSGHNGLVVNGATVTVNNLATSNNGWGGVDVDKGGGVTSPAVLTVNGVSHHDEALGKDLYVDDSTKNVSVNDTNSQYLTHSGVIEPNDIVYTLKLAPTNKDQCKKDGWKTFNNPAFRNQGQCVRYVEKSKEKEEKEDKGDKDKKKDKENNHRGENQSYEKLD